jgi:predicted kinase
VKALYGQENPSSAQDVIEGRLIQIGLRALELGNNVVIDYGLWGRDERSALRQAAADLGALVDMRYFEFTPAEQRSRLDQRLAEASHMTWHISDEELVEWAANFDIPTPGERAGHSDGSGRCTSAQTSQTNTWACVLCRSGGCAAVGMCGRFGGCGASSGGKCLGSFRCDRANAVGTVSAVADGVSPDA